MGVMLFYMCILVYRDQAQVLKEDREKLLLLQPMQPWFTPGQKEELAEVHSWIHHHNVPEEINTRVSGSINMFFFGVGFFVNKGCQF